MKVNTKFGRFVEGAFEYAPYNLEIGNRTYCGCTDKELYYAAGCRDVIEKKPEPRDGYTIEWVRDEVIDDKYETKREPIVDDDGIEVGVDEYQELVELGRIIRHYREVKAVIQVTIADYDEAMEEHLRNARFERGYTSREPDTYINSSVERWKQDAIDWCVFKDKVMLFALEVMNDYERTGKPPMSLEEFKASLPICKWTES